MLFSKKVYAQLKWTALILLPALALIYLVLGNLSHYPAIDPVVGAVLGVDLLFGVVLQLHAKQLNNNPQSVDGYVTPTGEDPDTGVPGMQFTISRHPKDFLSQGVVRMKIGLPPSTPTRRKPLPDDEV